MHPLLYRTYTKILQYVDIFVYEIGWHEGDLVKRAKIDMLKLSGEEWDRAAHFSDLLSVCSVLIILPKCSAN